jgi:invasion protein IalB
MKLLVSLAAVAAAMIGAAAAAEGKDKVLGAWKVVCEARQTCQAFLGLKDPTTGRLALSASAYKATADKHPTMVLTLPLGLSIRDGVALVPGAGAKPLPAVVDVCYPDGCRVVMELSPATLDALGVAEAFEVRFAAYGVTDRVESIKVPTAGLKAAVAEVSNK